MAFDSVAHSPAVYVRISKDEDDTGLGVERQRKTCMEMAERRRWPVPVVYTENDTSAFNGHDRPVYRQMLEAIDAGRHDAIIVYNTSRLTRTPDDLEDLIRLHKRTGVLLASTEGDIDLGTPQGQTMARMLGAVNANYSAVNQKALKDKHAELAAAGKVAGRQRVYGYDAVPIQDQTLKGWHLQRVINEAEAAVLRKIIAEVIEQGQDFNMTAKCRELNARGLRTVDGREFRVQSLRKFVMAWRNAGIRDSNDQPMGNGAEWQNGELVGHTAGWEPIVSETDLRTARGVLTDPKRQTFRGGARKHLLSNLLLCGRCGAKLQYKTSTNGSGVKEQTYGCKACYLGIAKEVADTTVQRRLAGIITTPSKVMREFIDAEPALVKSLRLELIESLQEEREIMASGLKIETTRALLKTEEAKQDRINAEISQHVHRDALRSLLESLRPLDPYAPFASAVEARAAVLEEFETFDLAKKRTIIKALMRVAIKPSIKGRTQRADAIARIVVEPLDPETGEPVDALQGLDEYADEIDTGHSVEALSAEAV